MACKITFITLAIFLLAALSQAAPADKPAEKRQAKPSPAEDLVAENEKDDLKPAASHWGGWGGWGGHYGGYYPYWGSSYWGYPGYGYGYGYGYGWPGYGFGNHGYWW